MADSEYKDIEERDLDKDPLGYIQEIYKEAEQRQDDLREINETNRLLYEGIDEDLEARKDNPKVKSSALLVPLLKPAIDTRIAEVITRLDDRDCPVTIRPGTIQTSKDEWTRAMAIERILNRQMRDAGLFPDIASEWYLGAEIYRTPSVVKVGWMESTKKVARVIAPNPMQYISEIMTKGRLPKTRVEFHDEFRGGQPYVEWIWPDEFLYQPNRSSFADCDYCIHRIWLTPEELMSRAKLLDYDMDCVKEYLESCKENAKTDESMADTTETRKGTPFDKSRRDGRIMLCENYCATYDESGREVVKLVVAIDNKKVVWNKRAPYKGIRFPFVPLVANRLPGTMEGLSSVDVGLPLQRIYNEMFNSYLDGTSYRMYPIILKAAGMQFSKPPTIEPGAMWECTDITPDGLRPLISQMPTLPDLPGLMEAIGGKLRDALNAHDISQGFQSNQYEKAASTKLRAMGASTRATPTHKKYADGIIQVAEMFLALNQQYAENKAGMVMDVTLDVPSLTNVLDPESDMQNTILLISQMEASVLYQNPLGAKKIRNAWEDLVRQMKKTDIDRYVPTDDEFAQMQGIQAKAAYYAGQKQSTMEQMSLMQGDMNGQEASPAPGGGQLPAGA